MFSRFYDLKWCKKYLSGSGQNYGWNYGQNYGRNYRKLTKTMAETTTEKTRKMARFSNWMTTHLKKCCTVQDFLLVRKTKSRHKSSFKGLERLIKLVLNIFNLKHERIEKTLFLFDRDSSFWRKRIWGQILLKLSIKRWLFTGVLVCVITHCISGVWVITHFISGVWVSQQVRGVEGGMLGLS